MTTIHHTLEQLDQTIENIDRLAQQFERVGFQPHQAGILADLHIKRIKLEREIRKYTQTKARENLPGQKPLL